MADRMSQRQLRLSTWPPTCRFRRSDQHWYCCSARERLWPICELAASCAEVCSGEVNDPDYSSLRVSRLGSGSTFNMPSRSFAQFGTKAYATVGPFSPDHVGAPHVCP